MLSLLLAAMPLVVPDLTPDLVQRALTDTKAEGCYSVGKSAWDGSSWGCFTTPYSRVVRAAKAAATEYRTFSESDVTPEIVAAGEMHVHAFARPLQGRPEVSDVAAIVIAPKGSKGAFGVIRPVRTTESVSDFKNLLGATVQGKSMTAVFPLSVLSEVNEIRVVYRGGANGQYELKSGFNLGNVR